MKPKDIFSLAVRLVGLFFIYLAARSLAVVFASPPGQVIVSILSAAFYIGVGWWLLGGAPLLMQRAYPEASTEAMNHP